MVVLLIDEERLFCSKEMNSGLATFALSVKNIYLLEGNFPNEISFSRHSNSTIRCPILVVSVNSMMATPNFHKVKDINTIGILNMRLRMADVICLDKNKVTNVIIRYSFHDK